MTNPGNMKASIIWAGVLALAVVSLLTWVIFMAKTPKVSDLDRESETNALWIAGYSANAALPAFPLERQSAIQIGLEETKAAINYFFVAAGACLALLIKVLLPDGDNTTRSIPSSAIILGWLSMLACCSSLCFGAIGFLYFVNIATKDVFSIYREVGFAVLFQAVFLILGAVLAGVFVMRAVISRRSYLTSKS